MTGPTRRTHTLTFNLLAVCGLLTALLCIGVSIYDHHWLSEVSACWGPHQLSASEACEITTSKYAASSPTDTLALESETYVSSFFMRPAFAMAVLGWIALMFAVAMRSLARWIAARESAP